MKITGDPTPGSACQPTSPPSPLENISLHYSYYLFPSFSTTPHARRGRRIRDGLRPLPPSPRRNLGFQFPIQGLSSSPKSQGGSKVVLRGSKVAPEIGFLKSQNSPSRPEAHPGRCPGTPPSASRLRWRGYLKITRFWRRYETNSVVHFVVV